MPGKLLRKSQALNLLDCQFIRFMKILEITAADSNVLRDFRGLWVSKTLGIF